MANECPEMMMIMCMTTVHDNSMYSYELQVLHVRFYLPVGCKVCVCVCAIRYLFRTFSGINTDLRTSGPHGDRSFCGKTSFLMSWLGLGIWYELRLS